MEFIPYGLHHIDKKDINEVIDVLKSNWITTGSKVKEFENAFSKYIGCEYSIAVCNGTAALDIAIQSLNIQEGSEIITTPFSFIASSNCILFNKCKPIFVDIKQDTFNIDPKKIEDKITQKTKAILYVDYAGQPCDINEIKEIAEKYNLFLIEDACHAVGAKFKDKKVGNFADLTIFSFHPVKHITTGEGGMITTNNEKLYKKLLMLRNHGIDKETKERFGKDSGWSYDMKLLGKNYRLTDFQCALGISQLKKLNDMIKKRQEITEKYSKEFKKIKEIDLPFVKNNIKHAWHIYTILLNKTINRNKFFKMMRQENIGVNVHYIPIYNQSYYKKEFKINKENFPVTEEIFNRIITLPLFPKMSDEEIKKVIGAVKKCIK